MGNWNYKLAALALAGLVLAAPALRAEDSSADDAMEEMRSTLGDLSAEVNAIAAVVSAVKFGGDFRFRYEHSDTHLPASTEKVNHERYRLRARIKMDAKVNSYSKFHLQLATGGSSATSTNLTMNDTFGNDPVSFDKIYVDIAPDLMFKPKAEFGKMGTPFKMAPGEMIFDGDLTPEGMALTLSQNLSGLDVTVIGGKFYATEGTNGTPGVSLEAGELVLGYGILGVDLTLAGGYYNVVHPTGSAYTPDMVDGYAMAKTQVVGLPFAVYYDYAKNTTATDDKESTQYLVGADLSSGKLISLGKDWLKLSYNYRETKKESAISGLNFSDFADGKLDAWGSVFGATIALVDNTSFSLTHISSEVGAATQAAGGHSYLFELWQADLNFKF